MRNQRHRRLMRGEVAAPQRCIGKHVQERRCHHVELILRKLGAGMAVEAILADHPRLTDADIRAAQAFAADYLADEHIVYG